MLDDLFLAIHFEREIVAGQRFLRDACPVVHDGCDLDGARGDAKRDRIVGLRIRRGGWGLLRNGAARSDTEQAED
ncbi:hypothetical protein GCM10022270_02720 [Terriglobus aquaticus]